MAGNTTQGLMLRDSHSASKIFGLDQGSLNNVPKPKFLFFVKFFQKSNTSSAIGGTAQTNTGNTIFNISTTTTSLEEMGFVAKMVDKPKVNFQTETLNQYNKRRLIQTKHEFQPLTMKFHDTVDNRIFQMFQAYYKFYYGDAYCTQTTSWQNDVVSQQWQGTGAFNIGAGVANALLGLSGNGQWGYNPPDNSFTSISTPNSYFYDRIEIYQLFNGLYDMFTLVNPKIVSFDPDDMNVEDGRGTSEITITFQYEGMILNVTNQPISSQLSEMGLDLSDQYDVAASYTAAPSSNNLTSSTSVTTGLTTPSPTQPIVAADTTATPVSTGNFEGNFTGGSNTGTVATAYNNNTNNPNNRNVSALTDTGTTVG